MAKVRNVSGEDLAVVIPSTGLAVTVPADGVFEVPKGDLPAFTQDGDTRWSEVAEKKEK